MTIARKPRTVALDWSKLADLAEFRYQLRRFVSFSEAASEAAGISAQHYQLLQVIATIPSDRESSISYIAERMVVRHNSAVELVNRAEKAGLVHRVADKNDHRLSLVEITPLGHDLLAELVPIHLAEVRTGDGELLRSLQRLIGVKITAAKRGTG